MVTGVVTGASDREPERTMVLVGGDLPYGIAIAQQAASAGFGVRHADDRHGFHALGDDIRAAGRLSALVVNMATPAGDHRFLDIGDGEFEALLDGSVRLLHAAVGAALPAMEAGGSIVAVISRGFLGAWYGVHAAAGHAATIGMVRSLSLELAPRSIRVNAAAPDFPGGKRDSADVHSNVAAAVVHLLGPGSAAINGETVLLDGGGSLRMTEGRRR